HYKSFLVAEINPLNRCPHAVVMPETADAFFAENVICKQLADERRIHPKTMLKILESAGKATAFPPDEVGTYIYRKADVSHLKL
ncbi:MAG: hypothetical protein MUC58_14910, partial [Rhizobiaceae bacterium]|nr:hypothetical protein [Rhizobiaceae bacterium]